MKKQTLIVGAFALFASSFAFAAPAPTDCSAVAEDAWVDCAGPTELCEWGGGSSKCVRWGKGSDWFYREDKGSSNCAKVVFQTSSQKSGNPIAVDAANARCYYAD